MSSLGDVLLDVTDLHTGFHTDRGVARVVDGVSLQLRRGRVLGVVGESGSGKSVMLRSIMGLLPSTGVVRDGSVRYSGRELAGDGANPPRDLWGREIAMILQDPMTSLNPVMRIGRQVTESLRHHMGLGRVEARKVAVELLGSVGLPDPERRYGEYPHQLSGGMRQRVSIAIALSCGPALVLADEPTTALDVSVQAQVLDLLTQQQRQRGAAMILVTHDLGVVAGRAHDVAVMYAGRIVETGPVQAIFSETRMPYTHALLAAMPRLDRVVGDRARPIPGRLPDPVDRPRGCQFADRCPLVRPRCREDEPPLMAGRTDGHFYRCWYPVGDDA